MKKVFLSSTARDLAEYRQAVYDAIESLDGYHCIRMENFGARDSTAHMFDGRKVEECDLFLGIIGNFHGNTPTGLEQSYTELENEAAVACGKPRLMFLSSEDIPKRLDLIEIPEKQRRQEQFRQRVAQERIIGFFNSPLDLAGKVVTAIFNWENEQTDRQPAAERGMHIELLAFPRPPQPYFAHPYPLQEHFTGRIRERQLLSDWLKLDRKTLLVLVGIGGLGKSALTWVWLLRDILDQALPGVDQDEIRLSISEEKHLEGVIWWSFYESDAAFTAFLNEALVYITKGKILPERIPSPYSKARTLFSLLQQHRILLVFDGFERLLRAYAGLGGAYQGEEVLSNSSMDPQSCVDPLVAKFLTWMASSSTQSRILITSRLFPKDLEGFGSAPLAGCQREDLESLDPEDAVTFFHAMGVRDNRFEIKEVSAPYGYHPLTLRLLAGYIVNHFAQPGDIQVAFNYNPMSKLIPRQHHILDLAYSALASKEQQLLSRIAAFRSPVQYTAVKSLSVFDNEKDLEEALQILIRRGLIFFEKTLGCFDMHPIVRRYAYEHLAGKQAIHARLRDYFASIPEPEYTQVHIIEELSSTIELFHHTIRAGLYEEALKLYKDRLSERLGKLGAFRTETEILDAFLKEGNEHHPYLSEPVQQMTIMSFLGIANGYIGQTRRALACFKRSMELSVEMKDQANQLSMIGNISFFQMRLGELANAEKEQRRAIALAKVMKNTVLDYEPMRLGLILSYTGRSEEALEEFRVAASAFKWANSKVGECHLWSYRTIRARLIGDYQLAMICARRSLRLAGLIGDERLVIRSKSFLAAALLDLVTKETPRQARFLSESELLLTEALTQCRQSDLIELEASILLGWAGWYHLQEEPAQSREAAEEALATATRCEYRLEQAEIYNFLARLALNEGNKNLARQHAQHAQDRAFCDGPPYCYHNALEEARELQELANK